MRLSPLLLLGLTFLGACIDPSAKLPNYGSVPGFRMTDSLGRPFEGKYLTGNVWVVDFIYTECPGPCPRMTSQMRAVERAVESDPDVRLVSISVDPAHDTPAVLDAYARRFGGPSGHWFFLTGDEATIHLLAFKTFHVGDVIAKMDHSTKFMVVDKRGGIRGYYSPFETEGLDALLRDVDLLRRQKS